MPAGSSRARTAPAAKPDEAQQPDVIEATIVETEDSSPKTAAFLAAMEVMRKTTLSQVNASVDEKIKALAANLDDVAEVVAAIQADPTMVGDADGDKLADLRSDLADVTATVDALADGRVTPASFAEVSARIADLAGNTLTTSRTQQLIQDELDTVRADFEAKLNGAVTQIGRELREITELPAGEPRTRPNVSNVPAVYGQVAELMREVEEISKNGRASYGSGAGAANYAFRGVDDAMNAVGGAMRKVGLIMRTEVTNAESDHYDTTKVYNGKETTTRWTTTRITMRYIFVSPIDGTEHALEGYGVGKDSADKDGSKALAAAMKYALFQGLVIPVKGVNIDPESDNPDSGAEEHNRPQGQQYAPEQPYDDGPPPDAYDQPAQQPRPAPPSNPAMDDPQHPDFDPHARAAAALAAARKAPNRKVLGEIAAKANKLGITGVELEGQMLVNHLVALRHTVPES